ncbi:nucleoside-diphosphate sugar epimerase [Planctomycetota bacterium]|nr:nucleoside-diphosphate sugar epimerase [Planctomycetota bacterium]
MFAIMGATGNTGRKVVEALLRQGEHVRAITRDSLRAENLRILGVEAVCADPQDPTKLTEAFAGARAAFVMVPPYLTADDAWLESARVSRAIAHALRQAEVPHAVVLSSGGAHLASGAGIISTLRDLETELSQSGVRLTLLRAADFMENWGPLLPAVMADGSLPSVRSPLDGRFQAVSVADIGRIAAERLRAPLPNSTCILNLVGPAEYSPEEAAAALERILERPVRPVAVPVDTMIEMLRTYGVSGSYALGLAEVYRGLNDGSIGFESGVGEFVRGTITLEDALREMLNPVDRKGK